MADEELIDDQYQLVMCIASGSASQVWEVTEKASARHLAMKMVKKDSPEFKENKVKMKREAEIMKTLDHPLIVKFEKFSTNRDHTYILMEYFRASNLKLQIKAEQNKVHLKIRQLFEGVCTALSHVHQKGFIHRDIKPDNVLMNRAGEIRLCDFSLSTKEVKGFGRFFAGKAKTIQGTRTYIAPETIRRAQPTFKTDLYSLGVLFFEVLTGKTPFQAPSPEELLQKHLRTEPPNPSEFNPNVSPEMDRIVGKLLKKKPIDRPNSADEVLAELKRIRIFKEDVVDAEAMKKQNEDSDALAMLSEVRLDSRADAKLKHLLATNTDFAEKFAAEKVEKAKKKKRETDLQNAHIKTAEGVDAARKARAGGEPAPSSQAIPVQPAPQPPVMVPQMPMQQMPMQGYPGGYPSYPQGYAPYPQGQMPPGMMPQMPGGPQYPPQQQMAYPQPIPQPQAPFQQPPQPAAPANRAPAAPAAVQRQPTPPAAKPANAPAPRPAPKPAPSTQPATDMDFMTDLPDVL